jgi:hypothetical protein
VNKFLKIGLIGLAVTGLVAGWGFGVIYKETRAVCLGAKLRYEVSCQESLMEMINDPDVSFRDRNRAVWALGQMAEESSLSFLESLQKREGLVGGELNKGLSRYEVDKAIKWCKEGNVTSWMYKNRNKW